ncbi:MAG: PilZ domain-containing protein [Phycisphaerales bacterium]|nr:PilZ domain-containing protein [Phycisphaerales bacterium]
MLPARSDFLTFRTLKLPPAELHRVSLEIEARFSQVDKAGPRWAYRVPAGIELRVTQVDGRIINYVVDPINLSKTGIAVLHGNFLHNNTPCVVRLATVDREHLAVAGTVVRIECVCAPVHLLGIKFNQEVDVRDFIDECELANSLRRNPPQDDAQEGRAIGVGMCPTPAALQAAQRQLEQYQTAFRSLGNLIRAGASSQTINAQYDQMAQQLDSLPPLRP